MSASLGQGVCMMERKDEEEGEEDSKFTLHPSFQRCLLMLVYRCFRCVVVAAAVVVSSLTVIVPGDVWHWCTS